MAEGQFQSILHYIRKLTGTSPATAEGDDLLLERFVSQRDEAAFAMLVARHGPLVLGVCRRVLRDAHEAEDAFQATFLVLARKAKAVRQHTALGSWLCRIAYHVALAARHRAARCQELAQRAAVNTEGEAMTAGTTGDLREVLDEELNRLPRKYHAPVVLCYLQGKTCAEAAQQLHWPAGTVKVRLMRARELLRGRLERRGLALAAAALTADLAPEALAAAVPAVLVESTVHSALAFAAGPISANSAATVLAEGVLQAMHLRLKKTVAALVLLVVVAGIGLAWQIRGLANPVESALATATSVPELEVRFRGKVAAHWFEVLEKSEVASCKVEAIQALGSMNAPPEKLLASLDRAMSSDADPQVRKRALEVLIDIAAVKDRTAVPLVLKAKDDPSPVVRQGLVAALGPLADEHEVAAQFLVAALKVKESRPEALVALYRRGPRLRAAESALRTALEDDSPECRLAAALVLGRLKTVQTFDPLPLIRAARREEQQALAEILANEPSDTSDLPVLAELGCVHALKGPGAVPLLVSIVGDTTREASQRVAAAETLGDMAAVALTSVPALQQALQDKDRNVRHAAAVAHWRLAAQADQVVPIFIEDLKRGPPEQSRAAAELLRGMGPSAKSAIPALAETFRSNEKSVQLAAALTHWKLAHNVPAVAPLLADLLQQQRFEFPESLNDDGDVPLLLELFRRQEAGNGNGSFNYTIASLLKKHEAAIPELLKILSDGSPVARKSALTILRDCQAPLGPATLGLLNEALSHADPVIRQAAITLWARQPDRDQALAGVLRGVQDPSIEVRRASLDALAGFGSRGKDALPQILQALHSGPEDHDRTQAARLLWGIDAPQLYAALASTDAKVRLAATASLGNLLKSSSRAARSELVGLLGQRLDDANVAVRRAAADQLTEFAVDPGSDSAPLLATERIEKFVQIQRDAGRLSDGVLAAVPKFGKEPALPVLRALLKDPAYRVEAAGLLGDQLDATTRTDLVLALAQSLRDKDPRRKAAANLLGRQGNAGQVAVPALEAALNDADTPVRIAAAGALWKIDARREALVVPVLCEGLRVKVNDTPPTTRAALPPIDGREPVAAALVLQDMAPAGKDAIPFLIEALRPAAAFTGKHGPNYHGVLRETLCRYGKDVVPHLIKALDDDLSELRLTAFAILADIGPAAEAAIPALRKAILDKDPKHSGAAQAALKKIAPNAAARAEVH